MRSRRRPLPEAGGERQPEPSPELRSFGRRRGRKLSARQQHLLDDVLPKLSLTLVDPPPPALSALFACAPAQTWLEIGFGGGEHLVWQARANPGVGIIGCEVFEDGVVKVLSAIDEGRLGNVRVSNEDARAVLRWLPPASLARVFILFPDPWPKKRHVKRRLINGPLLDELARVMQAGAELRIATDIGDYLRTILLAFRGHGAFAWQVAGSDDWRERGPDWPSTRYEAKAEREGRRRYFLRFRRTHSPWASRAPP
jgi:tRNA (guanine-N7-)-methyltransferase